MKGKWHNLSIDGRNLDPSMKMLHQAAQFLAWVSNSYLPKEPDDSQNSFEWNNKTRCLEGEWIKVPSLRILLDLINFEVVIDKYFTSEIIPLAGRTKEQTITNLQVALQHATLNPERLKSITQFSIPDHAIDKGTPFTKPPDEFLVEWSNYLSNTQLLLNEIKQQSRWASPVRIWPHHFDMGLYLPVEKDDNGQDTQSIGLGLAIPDSYVSEPYFYVNHWSKHQIEYPPHLPKVRCGYWNTRDWNGLVLPCSAVLSQCSQYQFVKNFFDEGLRTSRQLLNKTKSDITS